MTSIIQQVLTVKSSEKLSNRKIAKESDIDEGILSKLLNNKPYTGDTKAQLQKLETWLNTRSTRIEEFADTHLKEPEFLMLPTAETIWKLMDMARTMRRWSMVYEGSGIGKTVTAEEYQRQHNNVWIVTASNLCKSARAILSELCERMQIKATNMTVYRMQKAIAQALDGSNGLIIIDEAQYLSDDVLNGLRILAERKCGVFLLGNDVVRSRMSAARSQVNLNPIWSRMIRPTCIKTATKADIRHYMQAWGITDESLFQAAYNIVPNTTGQLRTLGDMIMLASSSATRNQEALTPKHLTAAHHYLKESIGV
ncbi:MULTISPECIES: AAA family ATPase [unclassified Vibrio]|uniref:AAA family ATPase n=1 Tax=unclassified Vibrio TaxID=2614977 RepID=UPI001361279E|nr:MULTISPECIES: AAA family ATPase [unclassified Vibrio]NAW59290.1 AAA family ATPase [Vibrio sp. V36_P2S2PM302]NAX21308.1 AAA family ATPase [Vibrio sp. V39_P1S14PM300]NAX24972.1 AAA family ATPase [Vibrio sp. V38_P2S17PM301]NAX31072.1 AAA family ATPase [Vibrio sp. V37_P2S8PM304]